MQIAFQMQRGGCGAEEQVGIDMRVFVIQKCLQVCTSLIKNYFPHLKGIYHSFCELILLPSFLWKNSDYILTVNEKWQITFLLRDTYYEDEKLMIRVSFVCFNSNLSTAPHQVTPYYTSNKKTLFLVEYVTPVQHYINKTKHGLLNIYYCASPSANYDLGMVYIKFSYLLEELHPTTPMQQINWFSVNHFIATAILQIYYPI